MHDHHKKNKILVIAAHPDDEVLGAGGTIAWYSKINQDDVYIHILTEGCSTQYKGDVSLISQKRKEAEASGKILGVREMIFDNLPDMHLDSLAHVQLNEAIERTIKKISPNIVFTHFPDINKDHALIYESTMVAVRPVPESCVQQVLLYAPSSATEWTAPMSGQYFMPNVFFNIEDTLDTKINAFKCYQTEIRPHPHPRSLKSLRVYAERTGITVGLRAAEPFMLVRTIVG